MNSINEHSWKHIITLFSHLRQKTHITKALYKKKPYWSCFSSTRHPFSCARTGCPLRWRLRTKRLLCFLGVSRVASWVPLSNCRDILEWSRESSAFLVVTRGQTAIEAPMAGVTKLSPAMTGDCCVGKEDTEASGWSCWSRRVGVVAPWRVCGTDRWRGVSAAVGNLGVTRKRAVDVDRLARWRRGWRGNFAGTG